MECAGLGHRLFRLARRWEWVQTFGGQCWESGSSKLVALPMIRKARNYTGAMSIESIPNFTKPAMALWSRISPEHKKLLLANVWCGACRHEVTITNFTGAVKSGDLLLVGKCAECHGDVARVIESA